ncbi:prepilin-type N-terminal cleavage/methylation domain-containing protein [Candidatus Daviesbacteria bacterium]|nr:prepilin-type N-terminal cleavage/methylation domain-containing protein [Candidatus Daviesbacteria bacterium]
MKMRKRSVGLPSTTFPSSKSGAGFTLVELLIVVAIIGVLSVVGLTMYSGVGQKARDTKRKADIDAIAKVMESKYNIKTASYPVLSSLSSLASFFVNNTLPTPPKDNDYVISSDGKSFVACSILDSAPPGVTPQQCINSLASGTNQNYCYCKTSVGASAQNLIAAISRGGVYDNGSTLPSGAVSTIGSSGTTTPYDLSPACPTVPMLSTVSAIHCRTSDAGLANKTVYMSCPSNSDLSNILNRCTPCTASCYGTCPGIGGFAYYSSRDSTSTIASTGAISPYYYNSSYLCNGRGYDVSIKLKQGPVERIDGVWTAWSSCSAIACGTSGTQTRTCTNPSPANGGSQCLLSDGVTRGLTETVACNTQACPVNGGWSDWSACSATACGTSGTQTRTCSNPSPANEGTDCSSLDGGNSSRTCTNLPCPSTHTLASEYSGNLGNVTLCSGDNPVWSRCWFYHYSQDVWQYGGTTQQANYEAGPEIWMDVPSGQPYWKAPNSNIWGASYMMLSPSHSLGGQIDTAVIFWRAPRKGLAIMTVTETKVGTGGNGFKFGVIYMDYSWLYRLDRVKQYNDFPGFDLQEVTVGAGDRVRKTRTVTQQMNGNGDVLTYYKDSLSNVVNDDSIYTITINFTPN